MSNFIKGKWYKINLYEGNNYYFKFDYLEEIPEQHRPKLITKEEKSKLLDLIKSI